MSTRATGFFRYDIYVNGMLDHSVVGVDSTIAFGTWQVNVFDIVAVDTSENQSASATVDVPSEPCF